MNQEDTNIKVPLISKIAYGMGDVGCNFSWMFVGNFLMIFYTDVFGIGMGAVAGLMLFSRFWDAINDPIVGGLSDKTHSKGKIQTVAFNCSAADSYRIAHDILGTSRLALHIQNCLYDNYLLYSCLRLYLCEYSLWDIVRSDDTKYRRAS